MIHSQVLQGWPSSLPNSKKAVRHDGPQTAEPPVELSLPPVSTTFIFGIWFDKIVTYWITTVPSNIKAFLFLHHSLNLTPIPTPSIVCAAWPTHVYIVYELVVASHLHVQAEELIAAPEHLLHLIVWDPSSGLHQPQTRSQEGKTSLTFFKQFPASGRFLPKEGFLFSWLSRRTFSSNPSSWVFLGGISEIIFKMHFIRSFW